MLLLENIFEPGGLNAIHGGPKLVSLEHYQGAAQKLLDVSFCFG